MAATDIKHIYITYELLISLLMVLGTLLQKCFKLLLQGKNPVAQMSTGGTEQKEEILLFLPYDYLSILTWNTKTYTNVLWYDLAPELAFWNRTCPKYDWLFICRSFSIGILQIPFLTFLRSKTSIMPPHNPLPFTGALPLLQCRECAQIVSSFPVLWWFLPIRWASFLYPNSFKLMKLIYAIALLWDMGLVTQRYM